MNYRHAFHAGNFADVWKHLVLVLCLDHLLLKEAPFRALDVFAGIGGYREEFRALLGVRKYPKNESSVLWAGAMGISAEGLG